MKKHPVSFLVNQRGINLLELVIGAALVSGIVLITSDLSKNISAELVKVDERTDVILDQAGVSRSITDDILSSVPSYNYLKTPGTSQSQDFWTMWEEDSGERTLEIKENNSCFSVLAIDNSKYIDTTTGLLARKKTLLAAPAFFYKPRTSMSSPLVFDGSKLDQLLKDNKLDTKGQMLRLSGMMPIYDLGGYYKDYGIILKIDADGKYVEDNSIVPTYSPPTTCTGTDTKLDDFLRCLPSPGGGAVNLYITPVNYITYCLRKGGKQYNGFGLHRKKNDQESLIATKMKSIKLQRSKSSNPIINIQLGFCRINDKDPICN